MTKEEIVKELQGALSKKRVLEIASSIGQTEFLPAVLIDLTFHSEPAVAFRASWILENFFVSYPDKIYPLLSYFVSQYPRQTNSSCRRHFTKIMMQCTSRKDLRDRLEGHEIEAIIESTFRWLTETGCPVAVQVNCLDILFYLRGFDTWIAEELEAQIIFLLKSGTAALQSRGKRLLKKLKT